ncbi:MAG: dimethylargininase [Candidatus Bipolaricaulis sp.]|nr:dimethylargininase [Candidatus Bipolaricaulis sp.]MDD5646652.1 dimethylargininase [Candidatus Bipolaricaulis sp.]
MRHALVRGVSPAMNRCELTHCTREPIDIERAETQHRAYLTALEESGCRVHVLPAVPELPDCVFIEDTAVAVGATAVMTRPGAASRRPEVDAVADALRDCLEIVWIVPPATLDGGDVLCVGRTLFVGASGRTNSAGVAQLRSLVAPRGYNVVSVPVTGCLHLKSAVTAVADHVLLVQERWVDGDAFSGCERIEVDPREPGAANGLWIGDKILFPTAYPYTAERLRLRGFRVRVVDVSEFAKAEGAVTCCSLIWDDSSAAGR